MAQPLIPVTNAATVLNSLAEQHLGSSVIVNDDLENITDFGSAYDDLDASTKAIVTSGLITLVTKQLFIAKPYTGNGIDIIRSRTEDYDESKNGIVQKNRPPLPTATSDLDAYDPTPGSSSDNFVNHAIAFETEYFMKKFSALYEWSEPKRWMTGMFLSPDGLMTAVGAIDQMIKNAIALNIEGQTMAAIRASMALNLATVTDLTSAGGAQAVNLLAEFNTINTTTLLAKECLNSPEFLRYAIHRMFVVKDLMASYSTIYNEKGYPQFTTEDSQHFIILSQFRRAMEQNLLSDVYHTEYLSLPLSDTVPAWKGLLTTLGGQPTFESTSTIKDTIVVSWEENPIVVDTDGILGTILSTERIGLHKVSVVNNDQWDPKGLKTNYFTHLFGQTIVDPYEVSVTFYVKDPAEEVGE